MSNLIREPSARGVMIAARVSPAERVAIERLARANDRTASREVRRAIRFYVGNAEAANAFLRDQAADEVAL